MMEARGWIPKDLRGSKVYGAATGRQRDGEVDIPLANGQFPRHTTTVGLRFRFFEVEPRADCTTAPHEITHAA